MSQKIIVDDKTYYRLVALGEKYGITADQIVALAVSKKKPPKPTTEYELRATEWAERVSQFVPSLPRPLSEREKVEAPIVRAFIDGWSVDEVMAEYGRDYTRAQVKYIRSKVFEKVEVDNDGVRDEDV